MSFSKSPTTCGDPALAEGGAQFPSKCYLRAQQPLPVERHGGRPLDGNVADRGSQCAARPGASRHGGLALRRLAHWFEGVAWRGADRVIAVTEVLKGIITTTGVPPDRVMVMSNGIESPSVATMWIRRPRGRGWA